MYIRFPSVMVLQGSGLMPVSPSVRVSKSISVMEFFVALLEGEDVCKCLTVCHSYKFLVLPLVLLVVK